MSEESAAARLDGLEERFDNVAELVRIWLEDDCSPAALATIERVQARLDAA